MASTDNEQGTLHNPGPPPGGDVAVPSAPRRHDGSDVKHLRKANESIAMRPKQGRITLLGWKIYQALIAHSQQQHKVRRLSGENTGDRKFTIRLSVLLADSHYDSRSVGQFKAHIREMQTTLIEWNSNERSERHWISSQLLGSVEIREQGAPHPTLVTWTFPESLHEKILDPTQYTKLLLEAGENMRSLAGAVLFETGLRYLTSPTGLTIREDVHWWASVLTGRSDITKVDYRYLKRDVILKALSELESLQDVFSMELIEHRVGRRVDEIQFRVKPKTQRSLDVQEPSNVFDLDLLHRIHALGVKEIDADTIYAQTDEGLLRVTVEAVEARMKNAAAKPLESPAAYFRDALKKGYANSFKARRGAEEAAAPTSAAPALAAPAKKAPEARRTIQMVRDDWVRAAAKTAEELYPSLDPALQERLLSQFEREEVPLMLGPIARAWAKEGVESKSAKHSFFKWLASKDPNVAPSTEQLLDFSLTGTLPDGAVKLA